MLQALKDYLCVLQEKHKQNKIKQTHTPFFKPNLCFNLFSNSFQIMSSIGLLFCEIGFDNFEQIESLLHVKNNNSMLSVNYKNLYFHEATTMQTVSLPSGSSSLKAP